MYVVHVVQAGAGRCPSSCHTRHSSRSVSAEAGAAGREGVLSHGVIHLPPTQHETTAQAAPQAAGALSCTPTSRTAVVPWLRQIAVLMRPTQQQHHHHHHAPPSVRTRCSAQDYSVGVLAATPNSPNGTTSAWGEGPDPLVIHLPGADGTAESSPADPASAGLPNTPEMMLSDSHGLALRDTPSAVQHRRPAGAVGFRPGSGSRTLPSMLQREVPSTLQPRATAAAPAAATAAAQGSSLQQAAKASGPLGFLPALQWGSSSDWGSPIGGTLYINPPVDAPVKPQAQQQQQQQVMKQPTVFWGSPIGGTLFINPSLEPAANTSAETAPPAAAAAAVAGPGLQAQSAAAEQGKRRHMYWGSPIGGTLYINPCVDTADPTSTAAGSLDSTQAAAAAAAATGATSSSSSSSSALSGAAGSGAPRTSRLPFLPPFKWGGGGAAKGVQWGSPIGGTLYINPQAPADWAEGNWGSGGSGYGSSGGRGGGSGTGARIGSSSSGRGGGTASGSGVGGGNGISSKPPGSAYVPARAAHASWGAVPPGLGLAKLGVGLMAAIAAAALAVYIKAPPASSNNATTASGSGSSSAAGRGVGAVDVHSSSPAPRGSVGPAKPAAGPEVAGEGVGFHQWMVSRLQSTLDGFEAEQGMLKAELAVLDSMAANSSRRKGVLAGLSRWLGGGTDRTRAGSQEGMSEAAAAASSISGGATRAAATAAVSPADMLSRLVEILEQLESIDVLKAALSAELAEHQQQLQKAQRQQQAAQEHLAALTARR